MMAEVKKMVKVREVCSCGKVIKEKELPEEQVPLPEQRVTHTLCEECLKKQLAELEKIAPLKHAKK